MKMREPEMMSSAKERESKEIEIVLNVWGPSNSNLPALLVLPLKIRNKVK